jgi:hypothetical protein
MSLEAVTATVQVGSPSHQVPEGADPRPSAYASMTATIDRGPQQPTEDRNNRPMTAQPTDDHDSRQHRINVVTHAH